MAVLLLFWITVGVLWVLGPPEPPTTRHAEGAATTPSPAKAGSPANANQSAPQPARSEAAAKPGRTTAGPVAGPDPALLEPFEGDQKLPRIGDSGQTPMAAYATGFDPSSRRPRAGLLIAGIGGSEADSLAAIKTLPEGITFAVSPYASDTARLLELARMGGHEYLLSLPLEPQGYPANDPDDRYALMTSLSSSENLKRLRAVLARVQGYVGVTNALGPLHGERLADVPDQFASVLTEAAHRGLLFVDARPNLPVAPYAWNRSVDLVIDADPASADNLDKRLDELTHIALDKGAALGLVSVPRPTTIERVAAWTNGLMAKGVALAPVSALVRPPAKMEDK